METSLFNDPAFWLLIAFVVPLIFRVPIAISLGLSALLVGWWWDMGVDMLSYNFFAGVAKVPLLAIPFFILAGFIMERAGIASRIVLLVETLVGDMTGGLAIATVGVAMRCSNSRRGRWDRRYRCFQTPLHRSRPRADPKR